MRSTSLIRIKEHDEVRHKIRGTFALPVSRVVVYAQAGNDDVKMDDGTADSRLALRRRRE